MWGVGPFQPAYTSVFHLTSLPHVYLEFADVLLVLGEEVRSLTKTGDLGRQGQVVDEVEGKVDTGGVVSADLELPQIVRCVLRSLSLVMIRGGVQRTSVLVIVTWDHTNDMRVCSHDNSGVTCRDIPATIVGNDAGHVVGPVVVIEAYGRWCLSSSWHAIRQQFSSVTNPHRNSRYLCSHMASLRPHTSLSSGSVLLGQSWSAGHSADSGTRG